eukprot:TRINITY_DN8759_c0_g1_i1.p1 TRINITY_DN8759_c0_g1~~TRINITY_DN8759_c0_g1_i1.p1  ORF type:complete len:132 (+),score=10.60 TRINITY_DN8759_c0_g1_i1:429-824(+)
MGFCASTAKKPMKLIIVSIIVIIGFLAVDAQNPIACGYYGCPSGGTCCYPQNSYCCYWVPSRQEDQECFRCPGEFPVCCDPSQFICGCGNGPMDHPLMMKRRQVIHDFAVENKWTFSQFQDALANSSFVSL